MRRVQPNKVTWQNDKKTLMLFDENGMPWGHIYLPRADDRALFKAARALIFAIEGKFNDARGNGSGDNETDRGRSGGERDDRRRPDRARPESVALRDSPADHVEGKNGT